MTLIKSISGIRGTIGGDPEDGLNPLAIVKFVAAYATFIRKNTKVTTNKIVVGRDARISGPMVKQVVLGTLMGMGFDVVDIDEHSLEIAKLILKNYEIPQNCTINYIADDFLLHDFEEKYDYIIGNPPFYKMKSVKAERKKRNVNLRKSKEKSICSLLKIKYLQE